MSDPLPAGSLILLIRLTRRIYRRATEDVLGMRLKAYLLLSNLRDGALPQSDLCASMHLDPNNCVLMLNDLEAAGHVERRRDPADRRRHIVDLTPAGRKALVACRPRGGVARGRGPRGARAGGARGPARVARPRAGGRAGFYALSCGRRQASS